MAAAQDAFMRAQTQLDEALRRARGRNAYRGRTHWQPAQRRLILEGEVRGPVVTSQVTSMTWQANGFRYRLNGEFHDCKLDGDWDGFLLPLLAALRGHKPHIHTYMHHTEYK